MGSNGRLHAEGPDEALTYLKGRGLELFTDGSDALLEVRADGSGLVGQWRHPVDALVLELYGMASMIQDIERAGAEPYEPRGFVPSGVVRPTEVEEMLRDRRWAPYSPGQYGRDWASAGMRQKPRPHERTWGWQDVELKELGVRDVPRQEGFVLLVDTDSYATLVLSKDLLPQRARLSLGELYAFELQDELVNDVLGASEAVAWDEAKDMARGGHLVQWGPGLMEGLWYRHMTVELGDVSIDVEQALVRVMAPDQSVRYADLDPATMLPAERAMGREGVAWAVMRDPQAVTLPAGRIESLVAGATDFVGWHEGAIEEACEELACGEDRVPDELAAGLSDRGVRADAPVR